MEGTSLDDLIITSQTRAGNARLYADIASENYYVEVNQHTAPEERNAILYAAQQLGLEPMDEDECPAEQHGEWQRIYCAEVSE